MKIVIDWSVVHSEDEFYAQVLPQVGAPAWHGNNLDALADSIAVGGINRVEPPYRIEVIGTARVHPGLRAFSQDVASVLRDAAERRPGIELRFDAAPR